MSQVIDLIKHVRAFKYIYNISKSRTGKRLLRNSGYKGLIVVIHSD